MAQICFIIKLEVFQRRTIQADFLNGICARGNLNGLRLAVFVRRQDKLLALRILQVGVALLDVELQICFRLAGPSVHLVDIQLPPSGIVDRVGFRLRLAHVRRMELHGGIVAQLISINGLVLTIPIVLVRLQLEVGKAILARHRRLVGLHALGRVVRVRPNADRHARQRLQILVVRAVDVAILADTNGGLVVLIVAHRVRAGIGRVHGGRLTLRGHGQRILQRTRRYVRRPLLLHQHKVRPVLTVFQPLHVVGILRIQLVHLDGRGDTKRTVGVLVV